MKTIRVREFGPPSVLRVEDAPEPAPGPGEVLVRVEATGVNPVETYVRAGTYTRRPPLPWTPGSDAGGVVISVGDGVRRVRAGDRVYTSGSVTGTYARACVCREPDVHLLANRLTFAQGAAVGVPFATAWRALFQKASLRPGETVLVHGASGGVGSAAVQLARRHGCVVVGTAGSGAGRALVGELGAQHVLDHTRANHLDELATSTSGRGADVVVEMLADRNLDDDLGCVAMRGRIVVVGSRGTVVVEPRKAMTREATVLGMSLFNATDAELTEIHDALGSAFEDGSVSPRVSREIPLTAAARGHEEVMRPGATGKIVLIP
jgi:NADPH2:quinone reductase